MSVHVVTVAVLLLLFLIAAVRPINLGALALVASFAVGMLLLGEDLDAVLAGFPVDVFLLLLGVTFLFSIAAVNGTIERVVDWAARILRGNRAAIPWALFLLAALPTTVGAAGPAGIAMLAPIAMRMSAKYRVDPRLTALMLIQGSNAGNMSPLNVLGVIVFGTAERNGLAVDRVGLWTANVVVNVVLALATFLVFGGLESVREARRRSRPSTAPARVGGAPGPDGRASLDPAPQEQPREGGRTSGPTSSDDVVSGPAGGPAARPHASPTVFWSTVAAIVLVGVGALGFGVDIGLLAVTAAVVLQLVFPTSSAGALNNVSWSTILLIGGVVTYVAVLQRAGTIDAVGRAVALVGSALMAALAVCLIAAVVSAFASSIGVLGALIPLSVPLLATGGVPVTGLLIGLAISSTAVDATPFSSIGALTVASASEEDRSRVYGGLVRWGFAMVVVAPLLSWTAFVLI